MYVCAGDLDGDMFGVIWDEQLVPPKAREFDPEDYSKIQRSGVKAETGRGSEADFIIKVMSNSLLGKIAHQYLSIVDLKPDGAADELAIKLARNQSLAVDFPKTGVAPSDIPEVKELIRERGYPDFMEKTAKKMFFSKSMLGDLYHKCTSVVSDIEVDSFINVQSGIKFDPAFVVEGYEEYIEDAAVVYSRYEVDIRRLFLQFDISNEAELVLGVKNDQFDDYVRENQKLRISMSDCWNEIKGSYRSIFLKNLKPSDRKEVAKKASAWYKISYSAISQLLSFAWISLDLVCDIRQNYMFDSKISKAFAEQKVYILRSKLLLSNC